MSKILIEYTVECNLTQSLCLASEILSEMGMTPTRIVTDDGTILAYNEEQATQLRNGTLTEAEYIEKNKNA
jgi:hypothetical protein